MNTLGRNRTFPIYKSDGTSFHNLVLHKSTCESVVMSLGDKITGDVYYKDNTLAVTMQEYIKFKVNPDDVNEDEVKYVLVAPPTVIREGMVSDNSELKGMTKYSFTFYHPMYMLGNFPFTDIAVLPDQEKYLSQNKTFNWIGSFTEFVAKLNKNLENTEWVVGISSSVVLSKRNEIPEKPLSFDKQYISDAVKTCYDTWKVPFTISPIKNGETHYNQGKRFLIQFGNPTEAIYEVDEHGQKTSTEYIFRFGQGVGLKNNSRTPRNNKIVTRIVGYGSERNIPYGYPQIPWYGNQDWDYTVDNDPNEPNSYPIYWGIYGGQYIKLIKHPFTRTTLMPSVYSQDVFNKVSPYIQGGAANVNYDPSIEIHDYYDAIDDQTHLYPNNVNPLAPSVEIHQFEDEYPHLLNMKIKAVEPYNDKYEYDSKKYTKITLGAFNLRINADMQATSNMNERAALGRLQNAINGSGTEFHEITNHASSYAFQCDASKVGDIWYVEYTSDNVNYNYAASNSFPVVKWDDTMDKDGNYNQSYFKITLPRLTFDLYACASIMEQMDINMRSGDCLGCTFPIQVDWDDYKANFYRADGTFDPVIHTSPNDGHVRDGLKYPDSSVGSIEIIVQKDIDTFGKLMPNTYQQPKGESAEGENDGDQFVILGISLPLSYITEAEERLDESMKQYMLENNVHYYDYPLKFDEHFLAENTGILAQIQNNVKVKFQYGGSVTSLFIKQIVIKFGEKVLPQYDITLTDDIEVVMSKLGQTTEDVSKLRVQMSELQKYYSENIINEINDKLSRIIDDVCLGRITFQQGLDSIGNTIFHEDARSADYYSGLGGRGWRVDKLGNAEFESVRIRSFLEVIELLINRQQAQEGDTVFSDNDQIDRVDQVVDENDGSVSYILSLKEKWDGYVTSQMYGNILKGVINTLAAKQSGVSDESSSSQGQSSDDGGNEFYTSWMHVVGTNATEPSLGVNQIRVVLYGDSDVPAQKNFAPCELMVIARRGCINYATPSSPQSVKDSIERRQRFFEISVTEGRVTKYTNVDRPVIQNGSYGVTIGELPDFVKRYAAVSRVLAQVGEHTDWLYAQGIVVGNMIKIDREGNLEVNYVDCGAWVDGSQIQEPTPRNGVYYYNTWNETAQQQETHDVWHNNAKWRCLQNQPVTVGGVTTYYEPSDANSEYWLKLEEGISKEPFVAGVTNANANIACNDSMRTIVATDILTEMYAYEGSVKVSSQFNAHCYARYVSKPTNCSLYLVSPFGEHTAELTNEFTEISGTRTAGGITTGFNRIKIHYDANVVVGATEKLRIEIKHGDNVRAIDININAIVGNATFELIPSANVIVKHQNNTYTPSTLSCTSKMIEVTSGAESSGIGTIKYTKDSGSTEYDYTTPLTAGTDFVSSVRFLLYYTINSNLVLVDSETVSVVKDGTDGTSIKAQYSFNKVVIHNTFQEGDIYMRTSQSDGTWSPWYRIVGENGGETDFKFGWSTQTSTASATTAPTLKSGTDWTDYPTQDPSTSSTKYYQWMKIQKKDGEGYDVGDATYIRIMGEDGTSPYFADLDNEMDSVPCTNAGVTTSAYDQTLNVGLWHGSNPMSISSMSYKVNNGATYSDSRTIDGITVTPSAANKGIRIQVANGVTLAEHNDIEIIVAGSGSGSKELHFTLNGVRAGSNGDPAVIYKLLPSTNDFNFQRTSGGILTPSSISLLFTYRKTEGSNIQELNSLPSGFDLRYSTSSFPTTYDGGTAWGVVESGSGISYGTAWMIIPSTVTFKNLYFSLFDENHTLVDKESIPVLKSADMVWQQNAYKFFTKDDTLDKPSKVSGIEPTTQDFGNNWSSLIPKETGYTFVDNSGLNTDIGAMSVWRDMTPEDEEYSTYGEGWRVARGNNAHGKHVIDRVYFTANTNNDVLIFEIAASAEMNYDGVFISGINPESYSESNWTVESLSTYRKGNNYILRVIVNVKNNEGNLCWVYVTYKKDSSASSYKDSGYYRIIKGDGDVYTSTATIKNGSVEGSWSDAEKIKGDKGDSSVVAYATPSNLSIPCNANGSVTTAVSNTITFLLKVGNNDVVVDSVEVNNNSIPSGVSVIGMPNANQKEITASTQATALGMLNGVDFVVYGTYDGKQYSAPVNVALIGAKQGKDGTGERGKMGRSYYYGDVWNASNTTKLFTVSDAQAPFFLVDTSTYYVYVGEENFRDKSMYWINNTYGAPSNSNENWELMTNDFKYLITEAVFGDYAHFGANIINADYRYSQYGFMRGLGEIKANISDSSQYKNIDPNDPFGTEEFLDDSRKIRNENLSGYDMVSPNTYTIIGSLIEFSTSSSASYGHSVYQNGDTYFRYKTKSAAQWGSWIAFGAGSYRFAISNNKNDTSSSTSSFSWQTYPPVPTASQPYLWLKTGSSSCMRVSSKVANFTLEKNEWYTIEIDAEYVGSMNMGIMVGNGSRKQTITTNQKRYELLDNDSILACYAIFKYTGDTITDANVWSQFDGYVEFEAVYHAQFVPYLCEDLKSGKFVVNNIIARGQLHGDSLYYEQIGTAQNDRVYVGNMSIITIPYQASNCIVVLPNPSKSEGRTVEIFSGLQKDSYWRLAYEGATSNSTFKTLIGASNTSVIKADGTQANDYTYAKLWSDGANWYFLKIEREITKVENGETRYYIIDALRVVPNT